MTAKQICKWMANIFDAPCNYTFDDVDIIYTIAEDDENWCEKNCKDNFAMCWEHYFKILEKNGRLE